MQSSLAILMTAAVAALAPVAAFAGDTSGGVAEAPKHDPLNAVVKVETVVSTPICGIPWQNRPQISLSGTGVILPGNRILTNAHNVADSTLITLRKKNDDNLCVAKVRFVDHECDLALLEAETPDFFKDITPLELAETPPPQSTVVAAGFPIGGDGISLTQGIISRIEIRRYAHSGQYLLAAQIDAAINPGNSGGPVLFNGKVVGIAFQGDSRGESLGYMIPSEVIRHFLKDIEDGLVDGFGRLGFKFINLDNADTRAYLKMKPEQSGIMVCRVFPGTDRNLIRENDVILAIDGHRIANNCNIRLPDGQPRHFLAVVTEKQVGEKVKLSLLRNGEVMEAELPVRKFHEKVEARIYDQRPEYFIIGGLVFTKLSYSYLDEWEKNSPPEELLRNIDEEKSAPDDCVVVLSMVLGDRVNIGYEGLAARRLISINGKNIRNLKEVAEIAGKSKGEYITFLFENDLPIILNLAKIRSATPYILRRYQIPADRYLK